MSKLYRLYIDESGRHGYGGDMTLPKDRYLALMGVIFTKEHDEEFISPRMEEIRNLFITEENPFPRCLHLRDIRNKTGPFAILHSEEVRGAFDEKYISLLEDGEFTICCIVLDKKTHIERYGTAASHAYHYCLSVLLERYVSFLNERGARGDVIAESRGKKEDRALRAEFEHFYEGGTDWLAAAKVQKALTSKDIKIQGKVQCIAGLELADLLAMPYLYYVLKENGAIAMTYDNFSKKVVETTKSKIRSVRGIVKGYGIKLIQ